MTHTQVKHPHTNSLKPSARQYSSTAKSNKANVNKGHFDLESEERLREFQRKLSKGWEEKYHEYRRLWIELPERQVVREWPLLVDLELVSRCNLRCPMCPTVTQEFEEKRVHPFKTGLMNWALVKKIIDEVAGHIYSLRLSWVGEPTLHPRLVDAVRYAKEAGIPEVSFLTNGSRLHLSYMKSLIDSGLDLMTISIDGMDEIYDSIRAPLKFSKTLSKLTKLREYMTLNNVEKPVLKIQGVWPAIKPDPEAFYNTFEPLVDMIAFNPLIDYLHNDNDIKYVPDFYCPQPYQRIVIGASGKASMCSSDDFQDVTIGDANSQSIFEMWHGKRFEQVREMHRRDCGFKSIKPCKNCFYPRETEVNESVSIQGREVHIESFVNRSQIIGL